MGHLSGWTALTLAVGAAWLGAAAAEELVAIRPGIMCAAADALAKLTLPNGDSRTHAPSPRPGDLGIASAGGCIDIPPGARLTVQQAFRNTSRVIYAGPGAPPDGAMTVPNIDFQPADAASAGIAGPNSAVPPPGYAAVQHMPAGGGTTLVLFLDRRITPAVRDAVWGNDEYAPALDAEFTRKPPLNAQLLLLSGTGEAIGRRGLERPRANLDPSPVHQLPVPTVQLTVDYSVGMGGFNGPFGELLSTLEHGLSAVEATPIQGGASRPIALNSTLHSIWRVVPARQGGPEEIDVATCPVDDNGTGTLHLRSYRFTNGRWTVATRNRGECGDIEVFPKRSEFP